MKKAILALVGLAAIACAQSPTAADSPLTSFYASGARGGIIYKDYVTDAVYAEGVCSSPVGYNIGGRLVVHNIYPTLCGPLTYTMNGFASSDRNDQKYDHLNQNGYAWWVANSPAVFFATEACHLPGTMAAYANQPGTPYVTADAPAYCPPSTLASTPGYF